MPEVQSGLRGRLIHVTRHMVELFQPIPWVRAGSGQIFIGLTRCRPGAGRSHRGLPLPR